VINAMLADHELDEDIVLEIQHGSVTRISGGRAAGELEATLSEFGDPAFVVAEIGIGTHPAARPTAPVIESEKALGTAHLAVGNSAVIGGDNDVPIHLDGITLDPTIEVDQALVMREGTFEIAAGFGT
jgi:leucyl aminopeptidase (aminopeptidase T)